MKFVTFLMALTLSPAAFAVEADYACDTAWPVRYGIVPAVLRVTLSQTPARLWIEIDGREPVDAGAVTRVETFRNSVAEEQASFRTTIESLPSSASGLPGIDSLKTFHIALNSGTPASFTQLIARERVLGAVLNPGEFYCVTPAPRPAR